MASLNTPSPSGRTKTSYNKGAICLRNEPSICLIGHHSLLHLCLKRHESLISPLTSESKPASRHSVHHISRCRPQKHLLLCVTTGAVPEYAHNLVLNLRKDGAQVWGQGTKGKVSGKDR